MKNRLPLLTARALAHWTMMAKTHTLPKEISKLRAIVPKLIREIELRREAMHTMVDDYKLIYQENGRLKKYLNERGMLLDFENEK